MYLTISPGYGGTHSRTHSGPIHPSLRPSRADYLWLMSQTVKGTAVECGAESLSGQQLLPVRPLWGTQHHFIYYSPMRRGGGVTSNYYGVTVPVFFKYCGDMVVQWLALYVSVCLSVMGVHLYNEGRYISRCDRQDVVWYNLMGYGVIPCIDAYTFQKKSILQYTIVIVDYEHRVSTSPSTDLEMTREQVLRLLIHKHVFGFCFFWDISKP